VLTEYGVPEKIGEPVTIDTLPSNAQAPPQPQNVSGSNFYGTSNAAPAKTQEPVNQNRTPVQDSTYGNIYPIESLSPYAHKWTIRARVSKKSPIKEWHNQKGEGRLFSVTLIDETGEIRATAFHSAGENFDRWFELLQEGFVYYISSPCAVKFANKKFNQSNNDYELTFERDTLIEKAHDQTNVPTLRYNFTSIEDLQRVEKDTVIDCIGVLRETSELSHIHSKTTNKDFDKREITIVDETRHEVRMTLWGDMAARFDTPLESVIAFQGVKVSDFGGRSLSLLSSGSMTVDPDIEESHRLKGWYDAQGRNEDNFSKHTMLATGPSGASRNDQYKTIAQVKEENLGMSEKPDFFTIKATVMYVRTEENKQMFYPACQSENCNKKVMELDPGQWNCVSCDKNWDRPQYRYVLSMHVFDHTGSIWLSAFDEAGRLMLDKSADDLHDLRENDFDASKKVIDDAMCKTWILKCRAKLDTYGETQR
jgi:replication factor A1